MNKFIPTWHRSLLIAFIVGHFSVCHLTYAMNHDVVNADTQRAAVLKAIKTQDMIIYKPNATKAFAWVFTDLNCGYCVKLHDEIKKLLDQEIEVRYLAYPRHGIGSESYNKMVAIWCSRDPKLAMSRSMQGEPVEMTTCHHPIVEQMKLAKSLGVRGTPTIIFSDGTIGGGYLPASSFAREALLHSSKH
jgi:thiol:disulfide interchange protein DsbC